MKAFKAIAAVSLNGVIGRGGRIPWHLSEDFRWFKRTTTGHVIVMGRRTFESIGRVLPGRETIVLSRSGFSYPGVRIVASLDQIEMAGEKRDVFVCGGAQVYAAALPLCSDLYMTRVRLLVDGDVFFPPYEHLFEPAETLLDRAEFAVVHYRRRGHATGVSIS